MQCRIHPLIRRTATFGAALVLGMSAFAGVAAAAPASKTGTPTITEDTDRNDNGTLNNSPDDGDNRHPSGKDRSVEHGGSGNQGRAQHDPDDDGHGPERTNGGLDQPDGEGGRDLADQDGNNGCGNDDDFEDDNEGWCGKPRQSAPVTPPAPTPAPVVTPVVPETTGTANVGGATSTGGVPSVVAVGADVVAGPTSGPAHVLGLVIERSETGAAVASTAVASGRPAQVLGVSFERAQSGTGAQAAPAVLAMTGVDLTTLMLAAIALVLGGLGMRKLSARTA